MSFSSMDFFIAGMFAIYFCLSLISILGEFFVMKKYSRVEELFEESVFFHFLILNFVFVAIEAVSRNLLMEKVIFYFSFSGILLNINFLFVDLLPVLLRRLFGRRI